MFVTVQFGDRTPNDYARVGGTSPPSASPTSIAATPTGVLMIGWTGRTVHGLAGSHGAGPADATNAIRELADAMVVLPLGQLARNRASERMTCWIDRGTRIWDRE
jgi:hypothetical protein